MAEQTVAERNLESFLESISGDYVTAYNEILAEEQTRAIARRAPSNAETRKAAYNKAIATMDRKTLASIGKTVRGFLPLVKANAVITSAIGALDDREAEDLMVEVLEVKRLKEIADARYQAVRNRVFSAITEGLAAQGETNPEIQPGYIEVPKLGLKFTREGGGFKDPTLREDDLAQALGPELWEKVTTTAIIPAQEVRTFDAELFLKQARRKPALLEELRKALDVGAPAPVKFNQRAMDPEE